MIRLDQKYARQDFIDFLQDTFLKDYVRDVRPVGTEGLSSIKNAASLGRSDSLDLQIFELEYTGSANKRVTLTKEAFQLMKQSATFNALAVFYGQDSDDWRFSFLTANPERTEKGKTTLAYSNPRRYSFFLGPNAKVNTPTKFLINQGKIDDFNDLKSRFSIEVVNKEFYKEISKAFTKLVDGGLKLPFVQDKSQVSLEFAVRLIGRIIFCWFLREKKSDAGLALMPRELLSLEATNKYDDYYHSILEPIFFEVLNKPIKLRKEDFSKEHFSIVPYLNGGLFSPQDDDFYKRANGDLQSQFHNTLVIPDSWFKEFFETLETFNFTIDENTNFDEELSIDPEMLGRIFENLLAEINPETGESARKSTGSYYTPRTIVSYMVDESLLLYLKEQTKIDEEKIRAVISYDLGDDTQYPLKSEEREQIIEALEKIKILDPACGSGAFPIGALQKIVFILQQVDPDGQLWFKKQIQNTPPEVKRVIEREFSHKNFDYIRKLGIIRENIYGVDIQPIATEISRLRCFLTLVVDERVQDNAENRGIEPLPNLDFKFVTANSLIGLPSSAAINQMGLFEDDRGIRELKELRDAFFNATGVEREQLKLQFVQAQNRMFQRMIDEGRKGYADLTTKLSSWEPFTHKASMWFEPEWMFGIKKGFDIVIANPPYVSATGLSSNENEVYRRNYVTAKGRLDTYGLFTEKGINLLIDNGYISYIVPNKFLTNLQFKPLRKFILENCRIKVLAYPKSAVFEAAVNNIVFTLSRNHLDKNDTVRIVELDESNERNICTVDEEVFRNDQNLTFLLKYSKDVDSIKKKIIANSIKLSQICDVKDGIIAGRIKDVLFVEDKINNSCKKLVFGQDMDRYNLSWNGKYVDYRSDVMKKEERIRVGPNKGLGIRLRTPEIFEIPKLLSRKTAHKITATYDDVGYYFEQTLHGIIAKGEFPSLKFILGILNSKLYEYFYQNIVHQSGTIFPQVRIGFLKQLPIFKINPASQIEMKIHNQIGTIVGKIMELNSKQNDGGDKLKSKMLEKQIDKIVYELYGLNEDEIKIVEEG